jgi:hypothetical protein
MKITLVRTDKIKNDAKIIRCSQQIRLLNKKVSFTFLNEKYAVKKAYIDDIRAAKTTYNYNKIKNQIYFISHSLCDNLGYKNKNYIHIEYIDKTENDFLIGTDPELLLMNADCIIKANTINSLNLRTPFGSDGAMAELRPKPALTPENLVKNITTVFKSAPEDVKQYDWISCCYKKDNQRDYPVGSHIHFDNPDIFNTLSLHKKNRIYAVTNKIIDELLSIPLIRLDGKKGYHRRANCLMGRGNGGRYGKGYGYFGEWRSQAGRLEYRSLSGLILSNPTLCTNIFGTAKAIVENVYNLVIKNELDEEYVLPKKYDKTIIYHTNFNDWKNIPLANDVGCIMHSGNLNSIMNKCDRRLVNENFIKFWHDTVQELDTYDKYKKYIDGVFSFLLQSTKNIDGISTNLKKNWRIT